MSNLVLALFALFIAGTPAQAQKLPTATEIVEKSQQAFYYAGTDKKARVTMELTTDTGKKRTRILTMLRKNDPKSKNQKYFLYFHEPGDVRRTAFLVWKYPEKDDDRWIFIPTLNMVQRVAASDSRSSFVGSDFTYEDISGRDLSADTHTLLREENLGDADCYVIQSVPKSAADYTRKLAWIDKKSFLPLKEEYYDVRGELDRTFTSDEVMDVEGHPTVTKRTMKNLKSGHRTEAAFEGVKYDVGIKDDFFSERYLRNPPKELIQ